MCICVFVFIYINSTLAQNMMNQDYIIEGTNECSVLDSG